MKKNFLLWCSLLFALAISGCAKKEIAQQSTESVTTTQAATSDSGSALAAAATVSPIIMGTGTEWGHWRGEMSISGVYTQDSLYKILKKSWIPTRLEKTYLNSTTDMSHFQNLFNNGVCPVMLEENAIEDIFKAEYPTGNDWDASHVWNAHIQTAADNYLNTVIAPRIANMKNVDFKGLKMFYVLNPEFVFVGDCLTSAGYRAFMNKEIDMLRAANLPNLRIIRGFLVTPSSFEDYLPTIQAFAGANATMLSKCDYFGPEFHNQLQINATVASRIVTFLTTVKSYTGKNNFIPNSYIYWNTTYTGIDAPVQTTGSDADAAAFWNYLHAHRTDLYNNAGVIAWCLSATLEARGGSGLVEPQVRPSPFGGYVFPFGANNTYNQGGLAFANWMRDEAPYQILNKNSSMALDIVGASTASGALLSQASATWSASQQWVLEEIAGGYFKIKNKNSGLYVAVAGNSSASGAVIKQGTDTGQSGIIWTLVDGGNGYFKIKSKLSNLVITVTGASTTAGAGLDQEADSGTAAQLWKLNYHPVQ